MDRRRRRHRRRARGAFWTTLITGAALTGGLVLWAAPREDALPPNAPALEVTVDGLDCAVWCAVGVDAAFANVAGVRVDAVEAKRSVITLTFDPGRITRADVLARVGARWPVRRVIEIAPRSR